MGILTILKALLLAMAGKFEDEIKAWLPRITTDLKGAAVRRLPKELRARYEEEWEGCLLEIPGPLSRVVYAASLLRAASEITTLESGTNNRAVSTWRRFRDVGTAILMISACLPLGVFAAMAIRLTSPGPVFMRYPRVGQNGQKFIMYKFRCWRTAREDAPRIGMGEILELTNGVKLELTPVGLFLQRTSFDEFPQFWNVLRGDMTLVGPAAPPPDSDEPPMTHKPGITGHWVIDRRKA
jgi:lipopolysaccharide/colanic/teichoic acid biosynthesis glycosyltransferase